ncbi:MAG: putative DNA-binding domain-containing protein [Cardiobacteriaceae bacterium]|nr:putative DNA-binding domain-containing protein [Cardiobacteriaceae bacterium]
MQPHKPSSAQAQAMFADHVRDPSLPAPMGIAPERLAVYTKLVRNNLQSFLDLCFSESSAFIDGTQWQDWQNRFLIEARPESPFFTDIPAQFLAYLRSLPEAERPSENILSMMDFEVSLLHAETAIQPESDGLWNDETVLGWSPTARLKAYPCDFVSSNLEEIDDTPCHVLTWRTRESEVYYRIVDGTDLFLLEHFQSQNDTFSSLLDGLKALLQGQDIDNLIREAIGKWVDAGVLLAVSEKA